MKEVDPNFRIAKSPTDWPMLALKIDPIHNLVWASEVAVNGNRALGDMVLTREGDPIVCDGDSGGVYRVVNDSLQLINNTDFISPQTPVMLPDGEHLLIPDYMRGIGILSLRTTLVTWLNEGGGTKAALSGVDGLYFDRGTLLLTQNGTSPECVMELQPDTSFTQVTSVKVIERATATLGDPTHGVVVNGVFYYIANSGWSELDEHGNLKAGGRLTPARIMRFELR